MKLTEPKACEAHYDCGECSAYVDAVIARKDAEIVKIEDAAEERWKAGVRLLMGDKDKLKAETGAGKVKK